MAGESCDISQRSSTRFDQVPGTDAMAKKPRKSAVPKHDKLMRRMEIGNAAGKGRLQEVWEEIQRRSDDGEGEALSRLSNASAAPK